MKNRSLSLLVADPNVSVCKALADLLRNAGHSVSTASTIVPGLELLYRTGFDAMIVSVDPHYSMMDMTYIRAIKRKHPAMKIIGISTNDEPSAMTMELVDGFLRKPFALTALESVLQDALKPRNIS